MKHVRTKLFAVLFVATAIFVGCSDDEADLMAEVRVNGTVLFDNDDDVIGDVGGSFTGDGGSVTRVFNWTCNLATADYNADITATAEGSFNMVVRDSEGAIVLDRTLNGAVEPDSFSGVTSAGTAGAWTVTITVTNFNGDGSFSLSEGN